MRKENLVKVLQRKTGATHQEATDIVEVFFSSIKEALKDGDKVELRGFGSFTLRTYEERVARNPKTGETISVKPRNKPFFKAGKELREGVHQ